MAFTNILVPVDYSEPSRRALELAGQLDPSAKLTVIHVWDRPSYVHDEIVGMADGAKRTLTDLIRDNAEREMQEFLARATLPSGRTVQHRLISGEPVTAILEEASKYDLLVVGTRGRTGMTRLLLGSVTEKLIRLSPIPVLTVPPHH